MEEIQRMPDGRDASSTIDSDVLANNADTLESFDAGGVSLAVCGANVSNAGGTSSAQFKLGAKVVALTDFGASTACLHSLATGALFEGGKRVSWARDDASAESHDVGTRRSSMGLLGLARRPRSWAGLKACVFLVGKDSGCTCTGRT